MSDKIAIHNDKKPINVFISYKRDDNLYNHLVRIVKKTFSLLNSDKKYFPETNFYAKEFLDIDSIDYGEKWMDKVESAITDSDMFLAFVTPNYINSELCRHEYHFFSIKPNNRGLCIPVFWNSQDKAEKELLHTGDASSYNNDPDEAPSKIWHNILEYNGLEGILPRLVDTLSKASDSDYTYVETCIATWLADKIFNASKPILSGKINMMDDENEYEAAADIAEEETAVLSEIDGLTLKAHSKGVTATCVYSEGIGYTLKAGSEISPDITATCPASVPKRRAQEQNFIDENNVLTKDLVFSSPSAASAFVFGRSSNGKYDWKNKNSIRLGELLKNQSSK